MNNPLITIFTPTYNRAYILTRLYESLVNQTNDDFEWLIVDDGSTDNTKDLIQFFIEEKKINVRYYFKQNGGKHTAINFGVKLASGELFFIVDSDDYVTNDAVELMTYNYLQIRDDNNYCGVCGLRISPTGETIGGNITYDTLRCSYWNYWYKYKIKGDKADAFKTVVLKEYPFPVVEKENFVAEGIIYNRITYKYPLILFSKNPIVICEYLNDGLSAGSVRNRRRCSTLTLLLYEEQSKCPVPISIKMRSVINYWRFSFCSSIPFRDKVKRVSALYSLIAFPLGILLYFIDTANIYLKKK